MLPVDQTSKNEVVHLAKEFSRFAVVGVINTAINFAVLNLLSYLTGVKSGPNVIYMAMVAFIVATTNSYYMNKRWTFRDESTSDTGREFSLFLAVSIFGALVNSTTVFLITTYVHPLFGLSATLWLNAANLVATGLSLICNFTGYKLFVFKDK